MLLIESGRRSTAALLIAATNEVMSYDLDGNLAQDGLWTYTWDAENRLITLQSVTAVPASARKLLAFAYDYQGRRLSKQVSVWDSTAGAYRPLTEEQYWYDGWNIIGRSDLATGKVQTYLWGSDLSGSLSGAGGVGGLVAMTEIKGGSSTSAFYGYDGNGNVSGLFDAATGSTVAEYDYGPFGETVRSTGLMTVGNPFRFSTKFQDEESGLVYYGYRYYIPTTGRWLSRDPIGENGGRNMYCFVENKTLKFVDLFGLGTWSISPHTVDLDDPRLSTRASALADVSGFKVIYIPATGECKDGKIVVSQIISSTGIRGEVAHVDGGKIVSPECPVPPRMTPSFKPDNGEEVPYSYIDSPGDRNFSKLVIGKFKITAVAHCRKNCKDTLISRKYFEFNNEKRKLDFNVTNDPDHYKIGLTR